MLLALCYWDDPIKKAEIVEHVVHVREKRNAYKVSVGEPEGLIEAGGETLCSEIP
jgi:hypothetical protein